MAWFLNNNTTGAADAAASYAYQHAELGGIYFCYGDEDKARIVRRIDIGRAALADRGMGAYRKSYLLCDVVRVDGRVPNKDIVDVGIYPPLPGDMNELVLSGVRAVMDAANTSAS